MGFQTAPGIGPLHDKLLTRTRIILAFEMQPRISAQAALELPLEIRVEVSTYKHHDSLLTPQLFLESTSTLRITKEYLYYHDTKKTAISQKSTFWPNESEAMAMGNLA